MKKLIACVLALALTLGVGAGAMACGRHGRNACRRDTPCAACGYDHCRWTDADGDGVCDLCAAGLEGHCHWADADGDGLCDVCGARCAQGHGGPCRADWGYGRGHGCGRHCR